MATETQAKSNDFYGDRLRLARLMAGITQQELGDCVNVSRQFIHQLESGAKKPPEDVLNAISERLEVSNGFFFTPVGNDVKFEQCHFRKRKTTPVNLSNRVLAMSTIFEDIVQLLDTLLELPEIDFPELGSLTTDANSIERAAEKTRIHWGLGINAPITNMVRALENAGAVITCYDNVSDKVDALSISRKRPIIVRNNAKESVCRLRFDLAHECGHLVLHQGVETGCSKTESEANAFASAFLFPRAAFIKEFPACIGPRGFRWEKMLGLKERWKISLRAMIYRANKLDLISAQQYRSANVYLNKNGQARKEKLDDVLPMEIPEILPSAIDMIHEEMNISIYDISRKLNINPVIASQLTGYSLKKQADNSKVKNIVMA
ncbi:MULTISPECIES: XRE family transcriptional regulator [Halomonas]|uniref:XRE family transcriptional regulator n=1 Tax=Halomonas TaxID=2745 RepID=UPI001C96F698|nr:MULTISPECIES: XRE family transcriptional regulator [Halomonas]MBY6208732.1 XRE family transcriptional regulator [Halomonas sp. DP3Y7-2]MBY6227202.1 XRE family transcriptional regulator [Halomonas sp. DP3Y7-1]MCA0915048.1 XRE family transcriptional regulator [Halomonas denitrificans]